MIKKLLNTSLKLPWPVWKRTRMVWSSFMDCISNSGNVAGKSIQIVVVLGTSMQANIYAIILGCEAAEK